MAMDDLSQVLEIEEEAFGDPWDAKDFIAYMKKFSTSGIVSTKNSDTRCILGFALLVSDTVHSMVAVANIAVQDIYRRQGIGSLLMDTPKEMALRMSEDHPVPVVCDVPEENLGSHLFLKSLGFMAKAIRPDVKGDPQTYLFKFTANNNSNQLDVDLRNRMAKYNRR